MNRRQRGHHVRSVPDWRGKLISDASVHSLAVAPAVDATVVAAADVVLPGAKGIAAHLRHVVPDEKRHPDQPAA